MESGQSDQYLDATFDTIEDTIYKSGPPPQYLTASQTAIEKTIANPPDDETVHHFICDELGFRKIEPLLERYPTSGLYFDTTLKHLRFITMPTNIHQDAGTWFIEWGVELKRNIPLPNIQATNAPRLARFGGKFAGRRKEPDAGLFADHNDSKPTIALGAGYSESLADLRNDARTLLEGSQGVIRLVILIKIEPLGPQDTSIQSVLKNRRQLYPPPPPNSRVLQDINIPWSTILRGNQPHPSQNPPPLLMTELRAMLDAAANRDLQNQG